MAVVGRLMSDISERSGLISKFRLQAWGDTHIHSNFSVDAGQSVAEICRRAAELGMSFVYVTDHFDHNPLDRGEGKLDPITYRDELLRQKELWKENIELRIGIEVSEPHIYREKFGGLLHTVPLDVVIGAVHYLPGVPVYPEESSTT